MTPLFPIPPNVGICPSFFWGKCWCFQLTLGSAECFSLPGAKHWGSVYENNIFSGIVAFFPPFYFNWMFGVSSLCCFLSACWLDLAFGNKKPLFSADLPFVPAGCCALFVVCRSCWQWRCRKWFCHACSIHTISPILVEAHHPLFWSSGCDAFKKRTRGSN